MMAKKWLLATACASAMAASGSLPTALAAPGLLLQGQTPAGEGAAHRFELHAESRQAIVGGRIRVDDADFEIKKVSAHQLVGAHRRDGDTDHWLVFSSSFSDQTASGEPWVAAQQKDHCDEPYNSFVVVYAVSSTERRAALPETPWPALVEDLALSDQSWLVCLMTRPPA